MITLFRCEQFFKLFSFLLYPMEVKGLSVQCYGYTVHVILNLVALFETYVFLMHSLLF